MAERTLSGVIYLTNLTNNFIMSHRPETDQPHYIISQEILGFIQARAMPNIGKWNNFELAKITKFEKWSLEKPSPQVSDHSAPTSDWNVPLPN